MPVSERELVRQISGADDSRIELMDDGFLSRGYVVDGGRLVFKFPKRPGVTYAAEARNLDFLSRIDLGVRLQGVAERPEDDSYIVLAGVQGRSLEAVTLDGALLESVGRQLGAFLRRLHSLEPPEGAPVYPLEELIAAWQKRYMKAKDALRQHFGPEDLAEIDALMMRRMPDELRALGEKPVYSHSDLGDGNILVDSGGSIGIIDFSESGIMDEASDFMDLSSDRLCALALDAYGADAVLRRKVVLQRQIRPIFVLDVYAERGEEAISDQMRRIRQRLALDPAGI